MVGRFGRKVSVHCRAALAMVFECSRNVDLAVEGPELRVQALPLDPLRQQHQRVSRCDQVLETGAEQVFLRGASGVRGFIAKSARFGV